MEPKNHPIEKEKSSSKPPFLSSMLIFRGVYSIVQIGFSHPPPAMLSTFVVVADPMTAVRLGAIEVTIDGTCSGRKSRQGWFGPK